MKFEENIRRLDEIIARIEDDETGLDEGIALYEEGIRVAKDSLEQLDQAKGKIKILQQDLNKLIEKDFDVE